MSSPHFNPYFQYNCICYFRRGHASRAMNRIVVPLDEFWQYIYVSVRVLVCHLFVQLVVNCAMASLDYSTFHIRVSTHLKLNAPFFYMSWKDLFKNSLPLSVRTQIGRLCEYLAKIERNAEATAVPVFVLSGTMCRNLENTSITDNKYLYLS
jgi:hypothetical protein